MLGLRPDGARQGVSYSPSLETAIGIVGAPFKRAQYDEQIVTFETPSRDLSTPAIIQALLRAGFRNVAGGMRTARGVRSYYITVRIGNTNENRPQE